LMKSGLVIFEIRQQTDIRVTLIATFRTPIGAKQ